MTDEIEFIKSELKKKGYPLENYVQALLVGKDWHVQPNAYFWDKDTNKGRELDIKAIYERFKSNSWSSFILNLFIQCRRLPGNAWIFFSVPKGSVLYAPISRYGLAKFLQSQKMFVRTPAIFDYKGTHFDRSEVLATNYCEIITDKKKSNKRDDNIWECVVTLIKATSQALEEAQADSKQYLEEDLGSFQEYIGDSGPYELISVLYPLIVFEGKIYAAKFFEEGITLQRRDYVQLFVDYHSGRYKGKFRIDIVTKKRFPYYLEDILKDLTLYDKRRVEEAKEYEDSVVEGVKKYFRKLAQQGNIL